MRPVVVLPPGRTALAERSINGLLRDYPEVAGALAHQGLDPAVVGGLSLRDSVEPSRLDQMMIALEEVLEWRWHAGLRGGATLPATADQS